MTLKIARKGLVNKGCHKKSESISSVSIKNNKVSSTTNNSFVFSKRGNIKMDYPNTLGMKHQRRASDTQFSSHTRVRYEPLKKKENEVTTSPNNLSNKQFTNRTFYAQRDNLNTSSYKNNKSFNYQPNTLMPGSMISNKTCKKAKSKMKDNVSLKRKKDELKSGYMKDFEKLMKERKQIETKSLKRMKVFKSSEFSELHSKVKIYTIAPSNKVFKKSKKALNSIADKQMYHKRVKSDQIYNVKLLTKHDDKSKLAKNKLVNHQKQISMSRPTTNKHESMTSGYSQIGLKKIKNVQDGLLSGKNISNFRSEN
jgi:hypothetical protein